MNRLTLWLLEAATDAPLPTPTETAFDPNDVTPGPIGFIFTAVFMVAVGLLVMSMMTKMSRVNARYEVREELEREEALRRAQQDAPADAASAGSDAAGDLPADDDSDPSPR